MQPETHLVDFDVLHDHAFTALKRDECNGGQAFESRLRDALAAHAGALLTRVRARGPRIHCITNTVAANTVANALLAVGAEPSMTANPEEVADFVAGADALSINLGTLNQEHREAIRRAVAVANAECKPWQLDPVFVQRAQLRRAFALELLDAEPAVVRANSAELDCLTVGATAARFGATTICVTGAEDRVYDASRSVRLDNGHPLMAKVTATGCAASALIGAFLSVEPDAWIATSCAIAVLGVAGSQAGESATAPGSFQVALIDSLYRIDTPALRARLRVGVGEDA